MTQTRLRTRIGDALPGGVKERLLNGIYDAYGRLARTRRPYEYLFILSHMRAGSSLLAMLLGNHPEICGYGETMVAYRGAKDLRRLSGANLYRLQPARMPGDERYMMDKIVYDELLEAQNLAALAPFVARVIFLIREPEGAIRSMMPSMQVDETLATVFYIRRLDLLEAYARAFDESQRAFLLSYEDLIERSEETLANLAGYLDLKEPLREQYEVLRPMRENKSTHHRKLHLGGIDRGKPASPQVPIAARNLEVATAAYDHCWSVLMEVSV